MEKRLGGLPMLVFTVVCALAGLLLRTAQRGGGDPAALIAVSAAVALALLAACFLFEKEREFAQVFGKNTIDAAGSGAGAVLLLLGCALSAWKSAGAARYIGILGAIAALGLVRAAALRYGGAKPSAALYVPSILFYVGKLFYDYRHWMVDPSILDYCFLLLAMLCFMQAAYHAAAFCFDRGSRRALVFFSAAGVYFGAVSLPGASAQEALIYGGTILCLLAALWQATRVQTGPAED